VKKGCFSILVVALLWAQVAPVLAVEIPTVEIPTVEIPTVEIPSARDALARVMERVCSNSTVRTWWGKCHNVAETTSDR
jgi:hypothetical protein